MKYDFRGHSYVMARFCDFFTLEFLLAPAPVKKLYQNKKHLSKV